MANFNDFAETFARHLEYAMNIAREFGYTMPVQYTLGTRHRRRSEFVVDYTLRLNVSGCDYEERCVLRFPNPEDGVSTYTRDHAEFMKRIEHACAQLVLRYADANPASKPSQAHSIKLLKAGILDDEEGVRQRAMDRTRAAITNDVRDLVGAHPEARRRFG